MENSKIEWCHHTFNPWEGCTKVSPGCLNCYAEARDQRWHGGVHWGAGRPRRRTSEANWREPRKWERSYAVALNEFEGHSALHGGMPHYSEPGRPRVFCASLADWLDEEVPIEWLGDLLTLIYSTSLLDWLLLTKRPGRWEERLWRVWTEVEGFGMDNRKGDWLFEWLTQNSPPHNVWIGTSVEDQVRANQRIPELVKIPAKVHFLSCEPLLGPLNLNLGGVDWIICGGESGPTARPMDPEWAFSLLAQAKDAGVPFFMKQMGGRADKGGKIEDFPFGLGIREFPA